MARKMPSARASATLAPFVGTGRACALALALSARVLPPGVALAQQPAPVSELLATASGLVERGDTVGAILELERAGRLFPSLAEAHYRRGLLLSRSAGTGLGDSGRRAAAEAALRRALALDHNNPFYLLELGRLRLKTPFMRLDAARLFRRAGAAARARGDPGVLAEVEYELGEVSMRRADLYVNRRLLTGGALAFDPDRAVSDWRYAQNFINQQTATVDDAGELDRRSAEDHYRAAISAFPAHEGANSGLLALLYDEGRTDEFLSVGRNFTAAASRSARAQLVLGLGFLRSSRGEEASAAFDSAVALMTFTERRAVLDLSVILRRADAEGYRSLGPAERMLFEQVFWRANDPLRLTGVNEHLLEHLARVAYTDIRFSAPELHLRGWETDRGVIYIRYGPPPVVAVFPPNTDGVGNPQEIGKVTTVWYYPERRLRFVFYGAPGYNTARFAGDFLAYAEDARYAAPVRYDNVPVNDAMDSVSVQVAQFRDSSSGTAVVFFAGIPVARMLEGIDLLRGVLETGLFVSDRLERPVLQRRRQERVELGADRQFEARTFEASLAPGEYRFRIEAREPSSRRAARGAAPLAVRTLGTQVLDASDILMADRVAPRAEVPRGRRDFFISPNPAMAYRPGQDVHLYWELYGLSQDSVGAARYEVTVAIRLESLTRQGLAARVIGGALDAVGVTAAGDDRVSLIYENQTKVLGRDRVPEYLAVDLGAAPEGVYQLEIAVRDHLSSQLVRRQRTFTVSRGPERRREAP